MIVGQKMLSWSFVFLFLSSLANAHQGHDHHPAVGHSERPAESDPGIQKIRQTYLQEIKPLFQSKCMDCHSGHTRYPWYHSIPGIKHAIDQDIEEARSHLDFSNDFPFVSHATVQEDLEAIQHTVSEGTMPPFSYRLFHPGSSFSDAEKKKVKEWVDESLSILGRKEKGERS